MVEGVKEMMMANATTADIVLLNKTEVTKYLPVTIVLVIIMCVGIVGNCLVIYIYKFKFKRSSARVYILSLAFADLTVCLCGIPYHVLDLTLILTYTNKNLCKVFSYFIGAFTFSSIFILLVVGLDRYLKVCRPLKRQIVDFGDRKACVIAVVVAMVISVPNGIIYGHSSVNTDVSNITGTECFIDDVYQGSSLVFGYMVFNILVFLVSILVLIIMYTFICHKIYKNDEREINLRKRRKACCCYIESPSSDEEGEIEETEQINLRSLNNTGEEEPMMHHNYKKKLSANKENFERRETLVRHPGRGKKVEEKNTRKITLMMMTITMVFVLAYFPFIIISLLDNLDGAFWDGLTDSKALLLDLLLRLYLINNAANPIIYGFWDFRFRKETVVLLKKMFFCWSQSEESRRNTGKDLSHTCSTKLTDGNLK